MKFAIIGGTGFYDLSEQNQESNTIETKYGAVTVEIIQAGLQKVAFLPRHGKRHSIAPHRVNYRANIAALKELGVENILASAAVGSMNPNLLPGSLVLPNQFLDFTWGRESTFFDEGVVRHVDVTEPYCPSLQKALIDCTLEKDLKLYPDITYVTTQGPRFETPAEIALFRRMGGDVVGMTGVPEVVLAREAGICYATVALLTNWAAGMAGKPLTHGEVTRSIEEHIDTVRELFFAVIESYDRDDCSCRHFID